MPVSLGLEDSLLLCLRESSVQGKQVDTPGEPETLEMPGHAMGDFTNVALGWQEDQDITRAVAGGRLDAGNHVSSQVVALIVFFANLIPGQILNLNRIPSTLDRDDGNGIRLVTEMLGESLRVDRGRSNDELEVRSFLLKLFEITKQKVDVQRSLVGFINDDRIVGIEETVRLGFRQQDAIGHELDQCLVTGAVTETDLETDPLPERCVAAPRPDAWRYCGRPGVVVGCVRSCRRGRARPRDRSWAIACFFRFRFPRKPPRSG